METNGTKWKRAKNEAETSVKPYRNIVFCTVCLLKYESRDQNLVTLI